ncbi:MAG: hypothetical protein JXR37_30990 [Kiritimatiellae bacterium]|nr:hypothetical protein [Kiritimatiellia bacterium]
MCPAPTAIVLLLLSAGLVSAQPRWSAGPAIGTTLGGVTEPLETVWGGQIAVPLSKALSIEVALLHFTDHPEEERLGISATAPLPATPVHLSLLCSRPLIPERIAAYLLAGIGYTFWQDAAFRVRGIEPGGPVSRTGALRVQKSDGAGYHPGAGGEAVSKPQSHVPTRLTALTTNGTSGGSAGNGNDEVEQTREGANVQHSTLNTQRSTWAERRASAAVSPVGRWTLNVER